MPRASILREKSWKISSHTFSGIIRNPMISFDSSSDSWCWFLLIHCRRLNNPTVRPDVDWTPAAGHLLGYQAPEPALLAMDLWWFVYGWKLKAHLLALYRYIHNI
jgi:hypothetical protein